MAENNNMTKREFLTHLVTITGATVLVSKMLGHTALAQEKRRGSKNNDDKKKEVKEIDWPMVEEGKGTAAALAYHSNHELARKNPKTDTKTDKGTPWEKQFCDTCSFYTSVGDKNKQAVGKCTLFPNALVAGKGICNSWAKKA